MAAVRMKSGSWVVVADGEKALLLKNEGDAMHPNLKLVQRLEDENPLTHDQSTDRPGRFQDGPSPHRSAVEETDLQRLAKERLAGAVAERLYALTHSGDIADLIVVAPPATLGMLRPRLHKAVSDVLRAEVPKSMTNLPLPQIEAALDSR